VEDTVDENGISNPSIKDMATTYFAGYVARALLKIYNCSDCSSFMRKNMQNKNYIKNKY